MSGRTGAGRRGTRRSMALAVTAMVVVMATGAAHAQDQAPQEAQSAPPVTPEANSAGEPVANAQTDSGDIVVTAQKREERLQDVPIAISVVTNQLLASTNSRNFAELQGTIPSVYFAGNSGGGRTYITLRGATGLALNTGDEPVAVYMDDVYLARGVTVGMSDLLDVGSIEIVRGPQGTLQGRNATAGAILIRSADPTAEFEGRITAGISDPLEFRTQAAIGGPIGDSGFRFRLAAGYVNDRAWAYNPARDERIGGAESFSGRGVLTYEDGPLSGRFVVDYSDVRNEPAIFRYAATTTTTTPGALVKVPTPNTPLPAAERAAIFEDDRIALSPGTRTKVRTGGLSSKLTYELGGVDVVSVTGMRRAIVSGINDSDGLAVDRGGYNEIRDESTSVTQEIRLQSSGTRFFNWIVGGYYFFEHQEFDDSIYNLSFTVPTPVVTRYVGTQDTNSFAAFADATLNITPQLQLIGGIRYTEDEKEFDALILPRNLVTNVEARTVYRPANAKYEDTSYRAKIVYKPSTDLMFYAGYGKGFRAGGFNPFAVQAPYAPETNKSAEAGVKGDLFDRRLSFSGAVYRNNYTNLQLRAGVPTGGAIITNAADSRIVGVEVELTARPTNTFRVTANGAFTDAYFTSFPRARDTLDREVDATGNKLPRVPRWQYFVSAEKDFAVSSDWELTAEANWRWRDRIYFFFTNQTDQPWQDGSGGELGARVSIHTLDGQRSLSLFGTNLTNARIINTAAVTFSYPQVGLNKPRVIGLSGELRF